jgi:hypothetical protein
VGRKSSSSSNSSSSSSSSRSRRKEMRRETRRRRRKEKWRNRAGRDRGKTLQTDRAIERRFIITKKKSKRRKM